MKRGCGTKLWAYIYICNTIHVNNVIMRVVGVRLCSSSIPTRLTVARRAWVVRRVRAVAAEFPLLARLVAAVAVVAAVAKGASSPVITEDILTLRGRAMPSSGTVCFSSWSTQSIRSTTVSPALVYPQTLSHSRLSARQHAIYYYYYYCFRYWFQLSFEYLQRDVLVDIFRGSNHLWDFFWVWRWLITLNT